MISIMFIRRIGWLGKGKYHIFTIICFVITVMYVSQILTYKANYVALGYSLWGISILLWQLNIDSKKFATHKPNTIINWWNNYPQNNQNIVTDVNVGSTVTFGSNVTITHLLSENATIERKIEFLIQENKRIEAKIEAFNSQTEIVKAKLIGEIKEIQNSIEKYTAFLNSMIAGHVVGTYDLNYFGYVLTLCGVLIQFFISPSISVPSTNQTIKDEYIGNLSLKDNLTIFPKPQQLDTSIINILNKPMKTITSSGENTFRFYKK